MNESKRDNDLPRTKEQLRDKAAETGENIVDLGHIAKDVVKDTYQGLKRRASDKYGEGKEKVQELEEDLVRAVRKSPMKSLLIAAGVGLALGCLVRDR